MFVIAHLIAGLIVGKLTGNYGLAVAGAVLIDLDHLVTYAKHGVLFNAKKLWKTISHTEDQYKTQRNFMHNIFSWAAVSIAAVAINFSAGIALSLGYLAHLLLDLSDCSDFCPFKPFSDMSIKGPITYMSGRESIATFVLFIVLVLV